MLDFNGDGDGDILWRHSVSGDNAVWFMDGVVLSSGTFTTPGLADPAWKIVGAADFNSDTKPDILWRHANSGQIVVWYMNGTVLAQGVFTTPDALSDPNWQIVSTPDMNYDGKPDILWRHAGSGENVVWFMNGAVMTSGAFTVPSALTDTVWTIVGTSDFGSSAADPTPDEKADILWRHANSGEILIWYMNGFTQTSGSLTDPPALHPSWSLVGTQDFNGDNRPDFLWRHSADGKLVVWHMSGRTLLQGAFTNPSSLADVNWRIVAPK